MTKQVPLQLTPATVRAQLRMAVAELNRLEAERDALRKIQAGLEGWLRLHGQAALASAPGPAGAKGEG